MKRILSLFVCSILLFSFFHPVAATENETTVLYQEIDLGNGITAIDEIIEHSHYRTTAKVASKSRTIKDGDTVIGKITIKATFHYDGTTVSVASKEVTQADAYEGWSYVQNSFTSTGGTVKLEGKLTKWIILNTSYTLTLSCDKNGNLS